MSALEISRYVMWVQVGLAALASLLLVFYGLRAARPRYVRGAVIVAPILSVVFATVVSRVAGFGISVLAASFVIVAGAVIGVFVGRSAKMGVREDKPIVRPSAAAVWVTVVAWSLAAFAMALIGPNAASTMMAVVLGTAAMGFAESVMHLSRARKVS
ncbi:MAG: hypothetical protein U1E26_08425 [Coriobacteriia bacterium]|nr:hypothetical protein [Coriobacteriia bacterium]